MLGFWMPIALLAGAEPTAGPTVRFMTFNVQELNAKKLAEVDRDGRGVNEQLRKAAAAIQHLRPDVLMLNEIDGPAPGQKEPPPKTFADRYLAVGQFGQQPISFPHLYYAPSNTGEPTGKDLDNDGKTDGPADAHGFGRYPGEYGMALLSRFPIDAAKARTLRMFRWKDMPGHRIPDGQDGRPKFYSPAQLAEFRLSSKSHWDVPIEIGGRTVHVLACHPTPPIFDGAEDRNGRRNVDELRLLADYLAGGERANYIKDDAGKTGGLESGGSFVIMGDLNADPVRYEKSFSVPPIAQVLKHPRVQDPKPTSRGAAEDDRSPPLANYRPFKTSHFGRIDYVLPSADLQVVKSAVFWPGTKEPHHEWFADPTPASDHRPVWADVEMPAAAK